MEPLSKKTRRKNRHWTQAEKIKLVKLHLEEHRSYIDLEKGYSILRGTLYAWVKRYEEQGEDGLKPNENRGSNIGTLTRRKDLNKEEQLELTNLKLRIENERLKKGYTVKGVGPEKVYVSTSNVNMKSSKD